MVVSRNDALSRRAFLVATGGFGLSAALAGLPNVLARQGWLGAALAAEGDLTRDTFSGYAACIVPGDDEYSVAQGVSTPEPGAVGAGAVRPMIATLDDFVPAPLVAGSTGLTLPASDGVATILNQLALEVNPGAGGAFQSPFARLSFEEKAEVSRRFETAPQFQDTEFAFVAGILPAFPALLGYSEAPVYEEGELTGRPVGWDLCRYDGPSEGWDEFKGYYRGRRRARRAHRFVKHSHGRSGRGR